MNDVANIVQLITGTIGALLALWMLRDCFRRRADAQSQSWDGFMSILITERIVMTSGVLMLELMLVASAAWMLIKVPFQQWNITDFRGSVTSIALMMGMVYQRIVWIRIARMYNADHPETV